MSSRLPAKGRSIVWSDLRCVWSGLVWSGRVWSGLGWVGLICVGFHVVSCRGVLVCGVDGAAVIDDVCMAVLASTNR